MCLCVNLSGRNAAAVAPLSLSWFDYVSHFSYRVFTGLQRFFYGAYRTRNGLGMGLVDVLFLIESNDTRAASPRMFPILFESTRMIWSDVDFFLFCSTGAAVIRFVFKPVPLGKQTPAEPWRTATQHPDAPSHPRIHHDFSRKKKLVGTCSDAWLAVISVTDRGEGSLTVL